MSQDSDRCRATRARHGFKQRFYEVSYPVALPSGTHARVVEPAVRYLWNGAIAVVRDEINDALLFRIGAPMDLDETLSLVPNLVQNVHVAVSHSKQSSFLDADSPWFQDAAISAEIVVLNPARIPKESLDLVGKIVGEDVVGVATSLKHRPTTELRIERTPDQQFRTTAVLSQIRSSAFLEAEGVEEAGWPAVIESADQLARILLSRGHNDGPDLV